MTFYQIRVKLNRFLWFLYVPFYKKFGRRTILRKPICVLGKKHISFGKRCTFREGARIEIVSKWNSQKLNDSSIIIGDNTSFEQSAHIISAGKLIIGNNCVFSIRTFISNCEHEYKDAEKSVFQQPLLVNEVVIGDDCFIGADVKIFSGVHIGKHVIVGANSIVMNDLPSYTVCVGVPARPIKKYNFETKTWDKI